MYYINRFYFCKWLFLLILLFNLKHFVCVVYANDYNDFLYEKSFDEIESFIEFFDDYNNYSGTIDYNYAHTNGNGYLLDNINQTHASILAYPAGISLLTLVNNIINSKFISSALIIAMIILLTNSFYFDYDQDNNVINRINNKDDNNPFEDASDPINHQKDKTYYDKNNQPGSNHPFFYNDNGNDDNEVNKDDIKKRLDDLNRVSNLQKEDIISAKKQLDALQKIVNYALQKHALENDMDVSEIPQQIRLIIILETFNAYVDNMSGIAKDSLYKKMDNIETMLEKKDYSNAHRIFDKHNQLIGVDTFSFDNDSDNDNNSDNDSSAFDLDPLKINSTFHLKNNLKMVAIKAVNDYAKNNSIFIDDLSKDQIKKEALKAMKEYSITLHNNVYLKFALDYIYKLENNPLNKYEILQVIELSNNDFIVKINKYFNNFVVFFPTDSIFYGLLGTIFGQSILSITNLSRGYPLIIIALVAIVGLNFFESKGLGKNSKAVDDKPFIIGASIPLLIVLIKAVVGLI